MRRLAFLTGLTFMAACFSEASPGTGDSTGGATGSTGGAATAASSGGTAGMGCAGECVPAAPSGWQGPVTLWEGPPGDPPPTCAGPYDLEGPAVLGELDEGQAQCACSCGPAEGIECGSAVELELYGNVGLCSNLSPPTESVPLDVCQNLSLSQQRFGIVEPAAAGGSCAPQEAHTLPTPTWGTRTVACGASSVGPDGCEGNQVCEPAVQAPFGGTCIYRSGDVMCPLGFGDRRLRYESFSDTRACNACSCSVPTATCNASVDLTTNGCTLLLETVSADNKCSSNIQPENARAKVAPEGSCQPSPSELSGEVSLEGVITFCCLP